MFCRVWGKSWQYHSRYAVTENIFEPGTSQKPTKVERDLLELAPLLTYTLHANVRKRPLYSLMVWRLGVEEILLVKARLILGLNAQFCRIDSYETLAEKQELVRKGCDNIYPVTERITCCALCHCATKSFLTCTERPSPRPLSTTTSQPHEQNAEQSDFHKCSFQLYSSWWNSNFSMR